MHAETTYIQMSGSIQSPNAGHRRRHLRWFSAFLLSRTTAVRNVDSVLLARLVSATSLFSTCNVSRQHGEDFRGTRVLSHEICVPNEAE